MLCFELRSRIDNLLEICVVARGTLGERGRSQGRCKMQRSEPNRPIWICWYSLESFCASATDMVTQSGCVRVTRHSIPACFLISVFSVLVRRQKVKAASITVCAD